MDDITKSTQQLIDGNIVLSDTKTKKSCDYLAENSVKINIYTLRTMLGILNKLNSIEDVNVSKQVVKDNINKLEDILKEMEFM